ncbi:family 16 glycosylhydrolase [candidate division KSB1 bacterium]|nr:family 16 glycosylhydrolase [candidate division KSB1 bacterium]
MPRAKTCLTVLLILYSSSLTKDYKGAEYRTIEAFVYGRFEARYKAPVGSGMLASFFTYHEITSSTTWNEIDFEILGRYHDDVQVTSIGPGQKIRNSHQFVKFDPHADFHVYAFEWTPDYIAWFIDGSEVYRQAQDHIQDFQYPQKIMMNIWNPTWAPWAGHWDDRILPLFAYYDWVAYYSYTPDSGSYGTDNNFTLQWKDEFDAWDQTRWQKATHTWAGNGCDFMPENVVFKDGLMILCLTNSSALGHVDKTPPAMLWSRAHKSEVLSHFSEEIDQVSAEMRSNYAIAGVTVVGARLLEDHRTVQLTVDGMAADKNYNLIALNIKDRSPLANRMTGQVLAIHRGKPLAFPVKINVGGDAYADYLPDQEWGPTVEYGHMDGYQGTYAGTLDIAGTDEDSLYQSELHELVIYNIRVPNGDYRVKLKIAENNFKEAGKRLYDIFVEGVQVADDLDVFQTAGANTAYELTAESVTVSDGILDIHFTNLWNFSLLNGLVVEQLSVQGIEGRERTPERFGVQQNYPNPFNATTMIGYDLPSDGETRVTIYDLLGRNRAVVQDGFQRAGSHTIQWTANVPSGVYFYRMEYSNKDRHFSDVKKLLVMK